MQLFTLIIVAVAMVVAHETGHVLMTRVLGGRFHGVVFRGAAIGVRLTVDGLSWLVPSPRPW